MDAQLLVVFGMVAFGLAAFGVWVWALVDAIKTPDGSFRAGNQLIWVLVILFGNLLGAIIYLVVGRPAAPVR
jgi:hypothetical protein